MYKEYNMSRNLSIFVDIVLPLIILLAITIIAIIMYKKLQKKYNIPVVHSFKASSRSYSARMSLFQTAFTI